MGCNILKFTDEDMKLSAELIEEYKQIREVVQKRGLLSFTTYV